MLIVSWSFLLMWAVTPNPGYLSYVGNYTAQFYVDYTKPSQGSLWTNQYNGMSQGFWMLLMCNRDEIKKPTTPTDILPVFSSQRAFYAFACSGFIWAPCTDFTDELSRCFCVCCKADSDVTKGNHVVRTPFHVRLAIFLGGCLQSSQLVSSTTVDSWQFGANARTKHTSLFRHLESEVPTNRFGFFSGFKKKTEERKLNCRDLWILGFYDFPNLSCGVVSDGVPIFLQLFKSQLVTLVLGQGSNTKARVDRGVLQKYVLCKTKSFEKHAVGNGCVYPKNLPPDSFWTAQFWTGALRTPTLGN